MPNKQSANQPDESLENPMRSRSLGIALGVTEVIFIVSLLFLATGSFLLFGLGWMLVVTGSVGLFTAFYNARIG